MRPGAEPVGRECLAHAVFTRVDSAGHTITEA